MDVFFFESDELAVSDENFSLKDLLRHNINQVIGAITHKNLTFKEVFSPTLPNELYGNHVFLDRILLNIIGNAIKFTQQGGIDLIVDYKETPQEGLWLIIQIKDTGMGIPAEKIPHLYEGHGVGLCFVKKYIEKMNGDIAVESTVGRGSCFTLNIPFALAKHPHEKVYDYSSYDRLHDEGACPKSLDLVLIEGLATFDLKEGTDLSGGCESSAKELLELLVASLPQVLSTLEDLSRENKYSEVADEVHKLYGGLCYVGVPKLREIARRLNIELQEGVSVDKINPLIFELEREAKKVIALCANLR